MGQKRLAFIEGKDHSCILTEEAAKAFAAVVLSLDVSGILDCHLHIGPGVVDGGNDRWLKGGRGLLVERHDVWVPYPGREVPERHGGLPK